MSDSAAKRRAIVLMVMCSILWSIGGIFIKLIPWHPLTIAGWRSLLAAVCMWFYMRHSHLKLRFNAYSVIGGISLMTALSLFVAASKLTTSANAIALQFTNPIFILLLSVVVLRQRIIRDNLIVVGCTMLGISLFFLDQLSPDGLTGNLLALLAGFMIGVMYLSTGSADEESRMSGLLLGHLFTAMVGIPFTFFTDTPVNFASISSILVLGIFQLGIPYVLYGLAVKHCPPLMCSLIGAIEPLLNPVWVFLFTGERPGVFALCGGAIVIASITVWCMRRAAVATAAVVENSGSSG